MTAANMHSGHPVPIHPEPATTVVRLGLLACFFQTGQPDLILSVGKEASMRLNGAPASARLQSTATAG